jgi:hypothetical protein
MKAIPETYLMNVIPETVTKVIVVMIKLQQWAYLMNAILETVTQVIVVIITLQ